MALRKGRAGHGRITITSRGLEPTQLRWGGLLTRGLLACIVRRSK
jgi:hypothetical protein